MHTQRPHSRKPADHLDGTGRGPDGTGLNGDHLDRAPRETAAHCPAASSPAPSPTAPTGDLSARDLAGLLQRVAAGDHAAFADLYDATAPCLFGLAHSVLKNDCQAEDATKEAYQEIWRSAPQFDPTRDISATAWMVSIAHRHAIGGLHEDTARSPRAAGRTHRHPPGRPPPAPAKTLGGFHRIDDTRGDTSPAQLGTGATPHPFGRLAPPQREALELTYFAGYTLAQLAESTQCSTAESAARLRDALVALRNAASDAASDR